MHRSIATKEQCLFLSVLLACFFVVAFVTYSHLGEDAFISFRYARNFAHGDGLVFNAGERVEGYSNLLWVLILAPFELLGARLHLVSRILSTLSFAGVVTCGWWCAQRIAADQTRRWFAWWLPVAIALEPYLHYHDDRGLETVPYAAALGCALFVLAGSGSVWIAGAFAAAAVLLRPEGIGFALAIAPILLVRAVDKRGQPKRRSIGNACKYLVIPAAAFLAQLIFRKLYYHEWIPNTMIAKRNAGWSLREVASLTCSHAFVPLIALTGCAMGLRDVRTRRLAAGTLLSLVAAFAFGARAGNLLNESFRYLIAAMIPCVAGVWLFVMAISDTKAGTVVGAACLALIPTTIFIEGSAFRGNGDAPRSRLLTRLVERETWNIADRARWYFHEPLFINSEAGRWVAANLPASATIGADQIGQFGFYSPQPIVDLLGLTDATVARKGLQVEYLKNRNVTHLVIQTNDNSTFWPREMRMIPSVPALQAVVASDEFKRLYRPRWFLRSQVSYIKVGFMIYESTLLTDSQPREDVFIGVSESKFDGWWRVRSASQMNDR